LDDLKERLGKIVVGYTRDQKPVLARDLQAHGAMTVLLKDAIKPNLVQTLENNPAFIHGGPFANIAHGCNSVIATSSAMKLADYVVTEAGFGADLGAEKFVDIKCRKSGLRPSAAVIVATVRAIKYHGGADLKTITQENLQALEKGLTNLERHVENVQKNYRIPCVDSIYRASEVTADGKVRAQIKKLQDDGYGRYPVCVAKTQYSFSTDAQLRAAPSNHVVNVREVRLAAGAEFIVMICGDIMTMPGLPKVPSAVKIDLVDGKVVGLF